MTHIDEATPDITTQTLAITEISALALDGKYDKAAEKLKASPLNESTKQHLGKALESNDSYVVKRTFDELNQRVAQALCWDCWGD